MHSHQIAQRGGALPSATLTQRRTQSRKIGRAVAVAGCPTLSPGGDFRRRHFTLERQKGQRPLTAPTRLYAAEEEGASSSSSSSSSFTDASVEEAETSEFALSFLWLDKNLAVAVDQVFGRGHRAPITEYFWWPREDAWEGLKQALDEREAKAWIRSGDKVKLLNTLTDVINYWSKEDKPSVRDAIAKFPESSFQG